LRLGDFAGARADFEAAIAVAPDRKTSLDARRNLAGLEADSGSTAAALARYDALVSADPYDHARRARVRLLIRMGRADLVEDDLSFLIDSGSQDLRSGLGSQDLKSQFLAERSAARLARNRPVEAEADALLAFQLQPTTVNARLLDRARLASGKGLDRWPDRPDGFDAMPDGGPALRADLKAAAGRLDPKDRLVRAVLLSAALDHHAALIEADRLVAESPRSVDARLARARIRFRTGRDRGALDDVTAALSESPEDPELIELRGMLRVDSGDHEGGLVDLKVAEDRGLTSAVGPRMARALSALGRERQAAEIWTRICKDNPLDPRAYLGLARARRRLGEWDRAFVALEAAASLVDDRSPLLGRVALGYASSLHARPDRLPRLLSILRRIAGGFHRM
jgi:tetratricopeptide (TPR) repeat protein